MGAVGSKLRNAQGGHLLFWCPGCDEAHAITVGGWTWNGSGDRPTFQPSVLVTSGHFASGHKEGEPCWCTYNHEHANEPTPFACGRCHSFVTDGRIQFLSDCSHALVNQTVDLPDFPYGAEP